MIRFVKMYILLTYRRPVPHYGVTTHHWLLWWLGAKQMPIHYLKQCCLMMNWALGNSHHYHHHHHQRNQQHHHQRYQHHHQNHHHHHNPGLYISISTWRLFESPHWKLRYTKIKTMSAAGCSHPKYNEQVATIVHSLVLYTKYCRAIVSKNGVTVKWVFNRIECDEKGISQMVLYTTKIVIMCSSDLHTGTISEIIYDSTH